MAHQVSIKAKSIRKAIMLLGVYALHLVFFQALMQASPRHNIDNTFKPLFARSAQKKQNPQPPNHPAVTYYTMLVKQGKDMGRVCNVVAPAVDETISTSAFSSSYFASLVNLFVAGFGKLHPADATFKLYRLIHVFLI